MIMIKNSKYIFTAFIFALVFSRYLYAGKNATGSLKKEIRKIFNKVSGAMDEKTFDNLPDGVEIIRTKECKGIKIVQGKVEIRVDTWSSDKGLLERYKECRKIYGKNLIAAVNGSFYSSRGVLGQVVSDGTFPPDVMQIPASLSRCFVASFRATKNRQFWYLGETSVKGPDLLRYAFKELAWFNVESVFGKIDNLLGGGGWILRNRHDVHRESYIRQRFLFRKEDQTSRHTVIAQDSERNLYLLVFKEGLNLHKIARTFVKNPVFNKVQDAIFLDGGSSSAIVVQNKYLVSPLYLIDKARFTAIQVIELDAKW
ncbi:MAG: phosphodiester glycosidase family protein [Candidatus Rifleibacteriota bacterium]